MPGGSPIADLIHTVAGPDLAHGRVQKHNSPIVPGLGDGRGGGWGGAEGNGNTHAHKTSLKNISAIISQH